MFEDGDFEVVDECAGEDDVQEIAEKVAPENSAEPKEKEEPKEQRNPQIRPPHGILKNATTLPTTTPAGSVSANESNGAAIDFTADVSMEMEKEEVVEDDDGVIQIDVNDTIIMEGEDGEPKAEAASEKTNVEGVEVVEVVDAKPDVPVEPQVPEEPMPDWYAEKLNEKMTIVKERMSKLARVLEFSYPTYKPWLEHWTDPVCHLDPPRRCPLARPHSNRWKFNCSRKPVQESTNKEEISAEGTVNKKVETVWRLGPTDGSGANTDNASQYPPFVMRVVKVFEEFIQNNDPECGSESVGVETTEENDAAAPETKSNEAEVTTVAIDEDSNVKKSVDDNPVTESSAVDTATTDEKPEIDENKDESSADKETNVDNNRNWLWLLVRSNSKDELMVFATGKKISQPTMEKLKETFETGPGKDCNVKSLYCKSISKVGSKTSTNITFLAGTEALDETVGGLKVQLAPKTNFWCNAAGVENLSAAVRDLLNPVSKFTVAEVGCGLGLIGLMQAPTCRQVIGLDAPSEVEEAEMTSDLNKIENSSFIMGSPEEMMTKITKLLKNSRSAAIVNANTKIGRTIEMMTALRKIPTLRRVVMITTLTKQSVRAILELTRPVDGDLGNPFMPVRAVLVDTLPVGPHFEVVIRMERLTMQKMNESWFWNHVQFRAGLTSQTQQQRNNKNEQSTKPTKDQTAKTGSKDVGTTGKSSTSGWANRRSNYRANRRSKMKKRAQMKAAGQGVVVGSRIVVGPGLVTGVVKNPVNIVKNPMASVTKTGNSRNSSKRSHSPDKTNSGSRKMPRNNGNREKSGQSSKSTPSNSQQQSSNSKSASPLKKNPMARGSSNNSSQQKRRTNWSNDSSKNRARPPKRMRDNHDDDLRVRLSDSRVDPVLMQQVQQQQMLLSLAQQKLNTQGPVVDVNTAKQLHNMLNIVLEQTNKLHNQLPRSVWDRIAPIDNTGYDGGPSQNVDNASMRDRYPRNVNPQDMMVNPQNREFSQTVQTGPVPLFPGNRVPLDSHQVAPAGMSAMEFMRGRSAIAERSHQGVRDFRKSQNNDDNWRRQNQFDQDKNRVVAQSTNKIPALAITTESSRSISPKRSLLSPPRLNPVLGTRRFDPTSFVQQPIVELRRPHSPPRRLMSPPRRLLSPSRNRTSEIYHRRPTSQGGQQRQQQPQDTNVSRRGVSPSRQRDQLPLPRANSPFKKFNDDWPMSNRSGNDQSNWSSRQGQQTQQQQQQQQQQLSQQNQQRLGDRNVQDKRWSNDRPSNSQNWNDLSSNDRYRNNANQDKWGSSEGTWMSGSGDAWNSKSSSLKIGNTDQQQQQRQITGSMNKQQGWGLSGSGQTGDNWNPRGQDAFGQTSGRMDNWRDGKKNDKEDWNDLPEDARDPWGDDNGSSMNKQRWGTTSGDRGTSSSANWGRDSDKTDQNWSNKVGSVWQNKLPSLGTNNKPQWSGMGNANVNDSRWGSVNDGKTKPLMTGNWQTGGNKPMDQWRPQGYMQGFSSQRSNPFGSNSFKDGR